MTDATTSLSPQDGALHRQAVNSPARVLFASLVGTTIEFFDFYVYATAAVIIFPHLFFPAADPTSAMLQSLATFSIAFFARPLGAVIFGHFGDRIGRKATLVAALMTMGISTVVIGLLPTYATIGVVAPLLLALCRFGQGLGLGGEWGGAVLLATENAPEGKRSWYAMFPQLGAPIGFILSAGTFLVLGEVMSDEAFLAWGWRIPFVASVLLVIVGLYVRLKITETPEFQKAIDKRERVEVPVAAIFRSHKRSLALGTFAALATFVLFYLMTVFSLSWGTTKLAYSREQFLLVQMTGVVFFRPDDSRLRHSFGPLRTPPGAGAHNNRHRHIRPRHGAASDIRSRRRLRLLDPRTRPDGPYLRADRRGAGGSLSDCSALYRRLDDLQPRRHLRRVAGTLHRHLARDQLQPRPCRLLSDGRRIDHARLPAAFERGRGLGLRRNEPENRAAADVRRGPLFGADSLQAVARPRNSLIS